MSGGRGTPNPSYQQNAWASQMAIDPSLQQISNAPSGTSYGGQQQTRANTGQFGQAQFSQYQYHPSTSVQHAQSSQRSTSTPTGTSGGIDTSDLATLNDALGSAGVDLRAEEESLQRGTYDSHSQLYRGGDDRSHKLPGAFQLSLQLLQNAMADIAAPHKISIIPEDSVSYLALALRARLQELIENMLAASQHRTDGQFDRPAGTYEDGSPMWNIVIRSDTAKQLAALERAEQEDERKVRTERRTSANRDDSESVDNLSGGEAMDFDDAAPKKKKKKDGTATGKGVSEEAQKRLSNLTATAAAGGKTYDWMIRGGGASPAGSKGKAKAVITSASSPSTTAPATASGGGSWARPYVSTNKTGNPTGGLSNVGSQSFEDVRNITMKDAYFAITTERGHGGGRGAARLM